MPAKAQPQTKVWKATYYGSAVAKPGDPPEAVVPRVKRFAGAREAQDGKPMKVKVEVTPTEFRTLNGKEVIHGFELDTVVYANMVKDHTGRKDENFVLISTLSHDKRLSIRITHLFYIYDKGRQVPRFIHHNFKMMKKKPQHENIPPGTQIFSLLYLGFQIVSDQGKSDSLLASIDKASKSNASLRAEIRDNRKAKKKDRITIESVTYQQETGTTVEEHPITLVVTSKSVRIVDSVTGETITKFVTSTVQKSSIVGEEGVLGLLVHDNRLNRTSCHLFIPELDGEKILMAITELAKTVLAEHLNLTERGPFTPAPNAPREAPPPELYKLQVHRADLEAEKVLGQGEFGEVYLALQKCRSKTGKKIQVRRAVKTLKSGAGGADKSEFLHEAMIMLAVGDHPNVVRMVGVAVQQAPWLVVLEYVAYGDLQGLVISLKEKKISLEPVEFLHVARQLAAGCGHLSRRRLVHMDLACRNALVGDNSVVKIGDFGMTMPFGNMGDFLQLKYPIRMAVKWGAPEAVNNLLFSEKSDMWSWGVTVWEMLSYGAMPWKGETNNSTIIKIEKGKRLGKPKKCPQELYDLLLQTWDIAPRKRPQFFQLEDRLRHMMHRYGNSTGLRDLGMLVSNKGGKASKAKTVNPDEEPEDIQADLTDEERMKVAVNASATYELNARFGSDDAGNDMYGWGGMGDVDEEEEEEDENSMYSGGLRRRSTMTRAVAMFQSSSRKERQRRDSTESLGGPKALGPAAIEAAAREQKKSGTSGGDTTSSTQKSKKKKKKSSSGSGRKSTTSTVSGGDDDSTYGVARAMNGNGLLTGKMQHVILEADEMKTPAAKAQSSSSKKKKKKSSDGTGAGETKKKSPTKKKKKASSSGIVSKTEIAADGC